MLPIGVVFVAIWNGGPVLKRRFGWKEPKWFVFAGLAGFGLFWTGLLGISGFVQSHNAVRVFTDCPRSTVEGVVTDFQPMPYEGHRDECFSVQEQRFCYSDYELTPGFHRSASHGGPIHEGLPVRITYRDGMILRLQIPADRVQDPNQQAAVERASERDRQRRMDGDPVERRMMAAFYLATLGWVIWWNVKWKLVIGLWVRPPYGRRTEIAFRLFFAANLVGSLIGLVTYFWNHPIAKSAVLPTLYSTIVMGAVIAVMSFIGVQLAKKRQLAPPS